MTDKLTLGHVGFGPLWNGPRNPDGSVAPIGTGGVSVAAPVLAQPDPRDAEIARLRADLAKFQKANDDLAAENVALRDALGAGREWLEVLSPPPPESISGQRMDRFRNLLVAALELGLD